MQCAGELAHSGAVGTDTRSADPTPAREIPPLLPWSSCCCVGQIPDGAITHDAAEPLAAFFLPSCKGRCEGMLPGTHHLLLWSPQQLSGCHGGVAFYPLPQQHLPGPGSLWLWGATCHSAVVVPGLKEREREEKDFVFPSCWLLSPPWLLVKKCPLPCRTPGGTSGSSVSLLMLLATQVL